MISVVVPRLHVDKDEAAIDFKPDAQCTWLLTGLDTDTDLAFGLCDLGMGEPELAYVSLGIWHLARDPRTSGRTRSALRRR
jgi:hypothetical protein